MSRTSVTVAAALLALSLPGCVVAYDCDETEPRDATVDAAGARLVRIEARAGSLDVEGRDGAATVEVDATACADTAARLERVELRARRSGDVVEIEARLPSGGSSALDMVVTVPAGVAVEIRDSSGDLTVHDVASLEIEDSSGGIRVSDVAGDVTIEDSSGEIEVVDVRGAVTVEDSSGDVEVRRVASLLVENDSSGDIDASDVRGDVRVRNDSSGGIDVRGVGGDFVVDHDSSGGIRHRDVAGRVDIPDE